MTAIILGLLLSVASRVVFTLPQLKQAGPFMGRLGGELFFIALPDLSLWNLGHGLEEFLLVGPLPTDGDQVIGFEGGKLFRHCDADELINGYTVGIGGILQHLVK